MKYIWKRGFLSLLNNYQSMSVKLIIVKFFFQYLYSFNEILGFSYIDEIEWNVRKVDGRRWWFHCAKNK